MGNFASAARKPLPIKGSLAGSSSIEAFRALPRKICRGSIGWITICTMPATLDNQLVVALSARALFDFEEENQVFEAQDDTAYMQLQLSRLDSAAKPGCAFPLVKKLLALNTTGEQRVEVDLIVSRKPPGFRIESIPISRSSRTWPNPGRIHERQTCLSLPYSAWCQPVSLGTRRGRKERLTGWLPGSACICPICN